LKITAALEVAPAAGDFSRPSLGNLKSEPTASTLLVGVADGLAAAVGTLNRLHKRSTCAPLMKSTKCAA
jgi:hypothetical protein